MGHSTRWLGISSQARLKASKSREPATQVLIGEHASFKMTRRVAFALGGRGGNSNLLLSRAQAVHAGQTCFLALMDMAQDSCNHYLQTCSA